MIRRNNRRLDITVTMDMPGRGRIQAAGQVETSTSAPEPARGAGGSTLRCRPLATHRLVIGPRRCAL